MTSGPQWRDMNPAQQLGIILGATVVALITLTVLGALTWACLAVWGAVFN